MRKNKIIPVFAILVCILGACALAGGGHASEIDLAPGDRVFLKIIPFDSAVNMELKHAGLDPALAYANLCSELHYQFFLKNQEESPDSAGATVRVTVSFDHIQPGVGTIGDFIKGTIAADRNGTRKMDLEWRKPPKSNVPVEFLALHLPRVLSTLIFSHLKMVSAQNKDPGTPPPLILLR